MFFLLMVTAAGTQRSDSDSVEIVSPSDAPQSKFDFVGRISPPDILYAQQDLRMRGHPMKHPKLKVSQITDFVSGGK